MALLAIYVGLKIGDLLGMILAPVLVLMVRNLWQAGMFHATVRDLTLAARDMAALLHREVVEHEAPGKPKRPPPPSPPAPPGGGGVEGRKPFKKGNGKLKVFLLRFHGFFINVSYTVHSKKKQGHFFKGTLLAGKI